MEIDKIRRIVSKIATPNDVFSVSVSTEGQVDLLDKLGNMVSDKTQKEFEALIFKDAHPIAPRKWRSKASAGEKEF